MINICSNTSVVHGHALVLLASIESATKLFGAVSLQVWLPPERVAGPAWVFSRKDYESWADADNESLDTHTLEGVGPRHSNSARD